ncbi:MAG: N-acetyltransferase [Thermomicrobiales bacterium]|nr:N-acetyltransferase [Thermomicrobiales bacterium]
MAVRVHPSAEVAESAVIGEGSAIWHDVQIRERARIGRGCILGKSVYVDMDVVIGDNVKIQNRASIYHGATIESGVFVGPHVIVTNDKRPRAINPDGSLKSDDDWQVSPVVVRYGASLGAGAILLPGVTIGRFALVGAGAVVTRDVSDFTLVVGNPARRVGVVCRCAAVLVEASGCWMCPQCGRQYRVEHACIDETVSDW